MQPSRNFCLLWLDACGALVKHSGLAVKLRDASDVLVCIVKAFIAWMAKPLVPQQLLSARLNCADQCQLVNDKLETSNVDSF